MPLFAHAVLDIIHGAAYPVALFIPLAEAHGQRYLGKLDDHTQQGGHPHPEHGAVAPHGNGLTGTHNIAGAYRSRQSRGHGLKRRYCPCPGFGFFKHLAQGVAHDVSELAELQETAANCQKNASHKHAAQQDIDPGNGVDGAVDLHQGIKKAHCFSP